MREREASSTLLFIIMIIIIITVSGSEGTEILQKPNSSGQVKCWSQKKAGKLETTEHEQ